MANFPLLRALGWALKSRVLSSELQAWDAQFTKCPNFADGSSHIATNQVILHGAGAEITPLESNDLTAVVPSGSSITFQNGSILMIESGTIATLRSTLTVDHTSTYTGNIVYSEAAFSDYLTGALAYFRTGAILDMKSGAELRSEPGAIARFLGSVLISDQGAGGTNGILTVGGVSGTYAGAGRILVTSAGDVIVQSGGELKAQAGSVVWLDGDTTVHGGGTVVLDGTGGTFALLHADGLKAAIEAINGGAINIDDSSTGTFTGSVAFGVSSSPGNHMTLAYPLLKIGDDAVTKLRRKSLPSAGGAFTASEADVWEVPAGLGSGKTWTPAVENFEFTYLVQQEDPSTQNHDHTIFMPFHNITFKAVASSVAYGSARIRNRSGSARMEHYADQAAVTGQPAPLVTV